MEAILKKGSFYVNLPERLFNKATSIAEVSENIDSGILAYLLYLILKLGSKNNLKNKSSKWVSLCSNIINQLNHKGYKVAEHLKILVQEQVLDSKPHFKPETGKKGICKRFAIKEEYLSSKDEIKMYQVWNEHIAKKRNVRKIQRQIEADYKTEHLTKWLKQSFFEMDKESAMDYIKKHYSKKNMPHKFRTRELAVLEFEEKIDQYSREGKDDRLHTYLTSLPRDLKQFITFGGSKLKEADIKSAQPFILTILLENIIRVYSDEINKHRKISFKRFRNKIRTMLIQLINTNKELNKSDIENIANSITIMFVNDSETIDFAEFEHFISLVREKDIYVYVGKKLLKSGAIWREGKKYISNFYDKSTNSTNPDSFETLRDCAKEVTIQTLYSSAENRGSKAVNDFKPLFPSVFNLLDNIKNKNKAILPILMQRIESKSILDYSTKKIAKKHPKMPLITKHDSVITTLEYFDIMKKEFQYHLSDYFGVKVKLGEDFW
ncbi:MAG TPA: hypothetical protein EYN07_02370 [Flavobacteriaceae bacterium]|nr:hypothetical protein [Flavobacteriaceae bacterium]HIN98064.1 hypothetical protein [Flavobacteriaceae bacterium]